MYSPPQQEYIGAAHGLSGILYVLLLSLQFLSRAHLLALVKASIDRLAVEQLESGNFRSSRGNNTDRLVQFCHGAPGVVHLYLKAAEVFSSDSDKYLRIARKCCDVIWRAGVLKKG